ncbi:hypothetical protein C8R47DRAFT_1148891 [Mycena vitilis]|nr:hypothetical protein C8R47DRAFT_1148891 [Mycena vitilis]
MLVAIALLPLLFPFSFTLASFIVDSVTKAALTCEPVLLQWQGGVSKIVNAEGGLIESLGSFEGTSFHWTADVAAGTAVAAQVTDYKGAIATSNTFTVQPGTTGCTLQPNQFAVTPHTSSSAGGTSSSTSSDSGTSSSDSRTISSTPTSHRPVPTILHPIASTVGLSASATSDSATYSAVQTSAQLSPSSDASARKLNKKKPSVGMVFAVLVPCLIVFAIIGLLFFRWLRRRRETLSALGTRLFVIHCFQVPVVQLHV